MVDYETDAVIQRGLREALGRDVTVLTIAHRLRTVMDADKIVRTLCVLSSVDRLNTSLLIAGVGFRARGEHVLDGLS